MYNPASFCENRIEVMHELIRANPLALLITHGQQGLQASPLPFQLYAEEGEYGTLRAHLARANPHWQELDGASDCLIIFQGAQGYVTPSWYPSKAQTHKEVPTWNYISVQSRGRPQVIQDTAWLERQLSDLTLAQESQRPQPWAITDAPKEYIATQLKAIIGIEIAITHIEGKWKMSQNKKNPERQGVIAGMRAADDPHQNLSVADSVERGTKR